MKFTVVLHAVLSAASLLPAARRSSLRRRLNTLLPHSSEDNSPRELKYDSNWAGAVLTGAGYRTVTGTIAVPTLKLPPGANSSVLHAVSAWVGIDGERDCPNAILQAGVDMFMNHSILSYWAWIEWFPSHIQYLPMSIRPGDAVTLNVTAPTLDSAVFSLTNHRTGQRDVARLTGQAPLLCGFSAEWIVEDFWASDGVPLPDFGSVPFISAQFATDSGVVGGVEDARLDGVKERADGPPVIQCFKTSWEGVMCAFQNATNP
ncbi:uncharacterized protein THITE_2142309 [Thermothielavioides terrestris NRRL 8126]|uniref:Concanavalin A-like lectin/glucanase n=1 Tax=Thermothielavioides terrestris (strain ATCC 38088 / NRRL 8126) TaxID=578455 RepID=G2QT71_THETT|nr:uncharacterized protein THITE_2142309 [Thermothielavioides terrestris NRRL 8126]AEO64397.1 hypothetical protein THITE_2142309 [Thermothielavioides terrestris NRRL 8126]